MAKQIAFDQEARDALRVGVQKLARAVKATLGPKGRHAIIDRDFGGPRITKDGTSVAEEIALENPYENIGAQLVKEATKKTSEEAGDGTTTATVLAEAIFLEGLRNVAAGRNPLALNRGIRAAVERVVAELKKMSRPIAGRGDIEQIAMVAANSDREVGTMIADAFQKVGKDGVITVEEGRSAETKVDVVEGMQFDRGYISPHFVTNEDRLECVLENPYILVNDGKLSSIRALIPLLEQTAREKASLLVIAEDVEGEALATLVVNRLKGIIPCCAVKAPGYGDRRKAMLEDLAVLTGGKRLADELGTTLEKVRTSDLGRCKRAIVTKDFTTILEGAGDHRAIENRVKQIRVELERTDSSYDKEKLQERLAKLAGGVAKISVGAATETEMKEKKARIEDALAATRAAVEEGVLPGGGVALLRAAKALGGLGLPGDEDLGVDIVRRALRAPIWQISENAGQEGAVVVRRVEEKEGSFGYDAERGEFGDLFAFGVIDPTKVARSALQNAASVSGTLLMTSCAISEKKEKKKAGRGGPGKMPGMGGGMPGMGGMGGMPGMGGMGGMGMGGMGGMGMDDMGAGGMGGMDDMDMDF
jgi:chaperonin GroEL